MTDNKIIFKSTSHPELTQLMTTDPEKYLEISQKYIDSRLEELLPIYHRWQQNRIPLTMYEVSLRPIESQLSELDFYLYDTGLEGKKQLTTKFYELCMPHTVDTILNAASKQSMEIQRKVKNLINRSIITLYNDRLKSIQRLTHILNMTPQQIKELPLISFLPFKNHTIGIEWILSGDMDSVEDIIIDWFILMCLNNEMFSSKDFINDLRKNLGENTFKVVITSLIEKVKSLTPKPKILNKLKSICIKELNVVQEKENTLIPEQVRLHNEIQEFIKSVDCPYLEGYTLKKKIPLSDFIFGVGYMRYKFHTYRHPSIMPVSMSLTQKSNLYFDVFLQDEPMSYSQNNNKSKKERRKVTSSSKFLDFQFVNKQDFDTILGEINRLRSKILWKNEHKSIIADNVNADSFQITPGLITYQKKYYLKSVRITSEISKDILSKIKKTFCLKQQFPKNKQTSSAKIPFLFNPPDDLSYLLAECERLKRKNYIQPNYNYPLSGEFELPWRYVFFYDGILYLEHPNPSKQGLTRTFMFRHPDITKAFRDIMSYIEDRCPKFFVRAIDGEIVALLNFQSFQKMIPQCREHSSEVYDGLDTLSYNKLKNEYSSSNFSNLKFVKKSPYISHLASLQVHSRKIYRILERVCHAQSDTDYDEFGFLFTVKESQYHSKIIYENVSDESRSSILFSIHTSQFNQAIEVIRTFFASREANKRQRLSQSTIKFKSSSIISYRRIHHTTFFEWRSNLSYLLH